jgi:sugar/nucleoside kinase (ribokinase family)
MTQAQYGLLTIGNALVDVLSPTTEEFIADQDAKFGMKRNSMNLIEEERALSLYNAMGPATQASGGSAANTAAAYASFGGKATYVGKIGKDEIGEFFRHDMKAVGVDHPTPPTESGTATGRSMILVTPDGSRTMNTFLGAAVELGPEDIVETEISNAAITYLEGYLFDKEPAMAAFRKAAEFAHKHGRKVSLSLSDPFCVHRHRPEFIDLVENHVDILFCNEEEIMALYEVTSFDDVLPLLKTKCEIVAITRSEKGSVIVNGDTVTEVNAEKVDQVIDTTGAGDMYAAGFLFGYTQNLSMAECGRLGSVAAAEVISHFGPRPLVVLKDLIPAKAA